MALAGAHGWPEVALGTLAEFRNGVNYTRANFGAGVKVINVRDFQNHAYATYDALDEINPEGVVADRDLLRHGDVLFVRSNGNRDLIGRSLFIRNPGNGVTHSAFTIRARFTSPKAVASFYAYVFRSQLIRRALSARGGGTNISNLNQGILEGLPVPLPSAKEQRKIAAILSVYDNMIENNLRRVRVLEEIAQTIHREWFVDFRFPRHKDTRMADSPLGEIPEGWTVERLGDALTTLESGSRPPGGIDASVRGVPSVGAENVLGLGRYDYSKERWVTREFYARMRRGRVADGDVLLYKDGAHIGRRSLFRDAFPHPECCINEHVFRLRGDSRCPQTYLYFWLDRPDTVDRIRALNTNAAQPGLNQQDIRGLPVLVPQRGVTDEFCAVVEPLLSLLFNVARQNRLLAAARDLLIPKLVSGRLDVSGIDVEVPEG